MPHIVSVLLVVIVIQFGTTPARRRGDAARPAPASSKLASRASENRPAPRARLARASRAPPAITERERERKIYYTYTQYHLSLSLSLSDISQ